MNIDRGNEELYICLCIGLSFNYGNYYERKTKEVCFRCKFIIALIPALSSKVFQTQPFSLRPPPPPPTFSSSSLLASSSFLSPLPLFFYSSFSCCSPAFDFFPHPATHTTRHLSHLRDCVLYRCDPWEAVLLLWK